MVLHVADTLHHHHVTAFGELNYIGMSPAVPNHLDASPTPPDWLVGQQPS